jgi:predicted transposase/invertase (TIGR01784 family)
MGIIETVETYYQEYGEKIGKEIGEKIGEERGKEIGKEIGKEGERIETITKLFKRGFEINQIADILEISVEEVQQILKAKSLI